ncbi:MAG: hypothetical protein HY540_05930 [Deltaproteobacteria bacterium]|nr:hypothetical protein [Deltaproteobacteria bacterium]
MNLMIDLAAMRSPGDIAPVIKGRWGLLKQYDVLRPDVNDPKAVLKFHADLMGTLRSKRVFDPYLEKTFVASGKGESSALDEVSAAIEKGMNEVNVAALSAMGLVARATAFDYTQRALSTIDQARVEFSRRIFGERIPVRERLINAGLLKTVIAGGVGVFFGVMSSYVIENDIGRVLATMSAAVFGRSVASIVERRYNLVLWKKAAGDENDLSLVFQWSEALREQQEILRVVDFGMPGKVHI